jgi:hypothetical protein
VTSFFKTTTIAANAFYGEFKLKSYYNLGFHLETITSFICHILRALYDLTAFILRLVITPLYLLNPLMWIGIPDHTMNLIDNLAGSLISLATIVAHPFIFICRTFSSMIFGYEENTEYDWGVDAEENDLTLAMTIF